VRLTNPWRQKFRSKSDHHQEQLSRYQFGGFVEKLEGGWICPMGILKDHKHGSLSGEQFELSEQRREGQFALTMRI
jgi:uncharacterized protein (DUF1786 family)